MESETRRGRRPLTSDDQRRAHARGFHSRPMRTRVFGIGAMALAVFGLGGCDTGPLQSLKDDLQVRLNVPGLSSSVSLQFVDLATDRTIEGDIRVILSGQDAGVLVDPNFFDPVSDLTVRGGVLTLGIRDGRVPSETSPVIANVLISAPGYVTTTYTLAVERTGSTGFEVGLVQVASPPAGVAAVQQSSNLNPGGGTPTEINLQTPIETQSGVRASVVIPAGTTLLNAQGFPLQGQVSAQLTYFNPNSPEALSAFPGGFENMRRIGFPDEPVPTLGFVAVQLTDGQGRRAANLSGNAQITIPIVPGTLDPATGVPIAAGDRIPIWSLEPEVGQWLYEGEYVVQTAGALALAGGSVPEGLGQNALVVQFETNHFTFFTFLPSNIGLGPCTSVRMNFQAPLTRSVILRISVTGFTTRALTIPEGTEFVTFRNLPRSAVNVSAHFATHDGKFSETVRYQGFNCNLGTVAFTLDAPTWAVTPPPEEFDLSLQLECSDGTLIINPSRTFYYREVGGPRWEKVDVVNGAVTKALALTKGTRYDVGTDIISGGSNRFEYRTFRFTEAPTSSDLGPNVTLESFTPRVGTQNERYRYRVSGVPELCP
jgi:hypothetical protein